MGAQAAIGSDAAIEPRESPRSERLRQAEATLQGVQALIEDEIDAVAEEDVFAQLVGSLVLAYTEKEDLDTIADYLQVEPTGTEMQRITGLSASTLSAVLKGQTASSRRREHTAIVGALIRAMARHRELATGSPERPRSAKGWLYAAVVKTPHGAKRPIEILADTNLAWEALAAASAAL